MPDMQNYLLTQGVLGVACLVLGWVVIKLYNKIDKLMARIDELHEARLEDPKQTTKEVTSVLSSNAESMRILAAKIDNAKNVS